MGDIGYRDEQGWFYFLYREGGGIRRNGDFIDPAPIEKKLAEHAQIRDVFVYGVPALSGSVGEKDIVAAIVVAKGNDSPSEQASADFNSAAIFDYCRQHLPSNTVPSYLQCIDEIPKTASEKPQERFLLEQFSTQSTTVFSQ